MKNVHVIRTKGIADLTYFDLLDFIRHFKGPYNFITHETPVELRIEDEVEVMYQDDPGFDIKSHMPILYDSSMVAEMRMVPWENIFEACNAYRKKYKISKEDVVILLNDEGNDLNWFSGFDKDIKGNYFISGNNWEYYAGTDPRYPLAYQLATMLLKHEMFENAMEYEAGYHKETRGCMMDFCENKKQISIKMRTADICNICLKKLRDKHVSQDKIFYAESIMEYVRRELKHTHRFKAYLQEPNMEIRGYLHHIYLPFMANKKVNLTPLERAVYLFFLTQKKGLRINEISNYKNELATWVRKLSNSDNKELIESSINDLCAPNSNSLSEKMARIKRKFVDILTEQYADPFIIKGTNGAPKSISLSRNNISWQT